MTLGNESIYDCNYPDNFKTLYKHIGANGPVMGAWMPEFSSEMYDEDKDQTHELVISENAGIVKAYEAVTEYCGWSSIEAGKTMGLFPYGKPNDSFPDIMDKNDLPVPITNRNLIVPRYPMGAVINSNMYDTLNDHNSHDVTLLQNRRDMAYAVQTESQQAVVDLIRHAVKLLVIKTL